MTNNEIIATMCTLHGITEEVHTFQRWKELGFCVQKGQTAVFSTPIWKFKSGKRVVEENGEVTETKSRMFMKRSAFFTRTQVAPLEKKEKAVN